MFLPTASLTWVGLALSDPVRQAVLTLLDGPQFPTQLVALLGVPKSNLSNHLACLRGCGLIIGKRTGRQIEYRLASIDLEHALRDLLRLETALECPQDVDETFRS
jgi:ArsR family transcriptional regulator, cadmium/lead-responsive transcriptional repressor